MSEQSWIFSVNLEHESTVTNSKQPAARVSPGFIAVEGDVHFQSYLDNSVRLMPERETASTVRTDQRDWRSERPSTGKQEGTMDLLISNIETRDACTNNSAADALQDQIKYRRHAWRWLLGSVVVFFTSLLALNAADMLGSFYATSLTLGVLFTIIFVSLFASLAWVVTEQIRDLRRLDDLSSIQRKVDCLRTSQEHGSAMGLVTNFSQIYSDRADVAPGLEAFHRSVEDTHNDAEVLTLYSRQVMRPLDERALRVIASEASQTALLTAISPFASVDVLVTLWRQVRMIRTIAHLYGGRPGTLSTFKLGRDIFVSLVGAGVTEVIADAGVETLGSTLAATLSAKAGQGIVMGVLTIRVGLLAIRLCRPLPFEETERPRVKQLRDQVFKQITQTLKGAGNSTQPSSP